MQLQADGKYATFSGMFFYIAIVGLLFLGLTNPVSGSILDLFLVFVLFSFLVSSVFIRDKLLIFSLLFVINCFFYIQGDHSGVIFLASVVGVLVQFLLEKARRQNIAIIVVVLIYVVSAFASSNDLRGMLTRDLAFFAYNNDPGIFLKTYQLVETGQPYYHSFIVAHDGRFAQRGTPTDIWGFRFPTLFYAWKFLPGYGIGIYYLFLVMSTFALYCAYKISSKYIGKRLGLLSSYLLFPYLHYAARDQMILETEWWAVMVFLFGVYFLLYKRYFFATIFLAFSVLVRELFVIPLISFSLIFLLQKRKLLFVAVVPVVAFCSLFLYHLASANQYISAYDSLFRPRVIPFGPLFLQQTLAFGSWEYLFYAFKPFYVFFAMAIVGSAHVFKKWSHFDGLILFLCFIVFPVAFLKIGALPYNDYWGIMFMPQILVIAPLFLGWLGRNTVSYEE